MKSGLLISTHPQIPPMLDQTVDANGLHFDREGEVTWRLREAAAPHRAFLNDTLMAHLLRDGQRGGGTARQILNLTRLPNTHRVVSTPDTHHGYGSPIGTVYASPATLSLSVVGVDISCGMSVVVTNLRRSDLGSIEERRQFGEYLRREIIPMGKGVARDNSDVVTDERELIQRGIGGLKDNIIRSLSLSRDTYEFEQDFTGVSDLWDSIPKRAMRGFGTLGSLGGGNHFIEFQSAEIMDPATARAWGIEPDQLLIMIHSGSRKFGYEVADHYLKASGRQFVHRARAEDIRTRLVQAARVERCRTERRDVGLGEFTSEIDDNAASIGISYRAPDGELITWNEHVPGSDLAPYFDPRFVHKDVGLPFALNPLPGAGAVPREAAELGQAYWIGVQASQNFAVLSRTIMLYRAAEELVRLFGRDRVQPRHLYDISHSATCKSRFSLSHAQSLN